jgi:choline dehydrogenase-like flavoprotein
MTANFDYIVVGSGAAGAAAAWRFSEKNANVLILELGDYVNTSDYPTANNYWEQLKNTKFNPVASRRKGLQDYPVDDSDSPISICNFNAVGGSTILFSAHFPRFLRTDFSIKTDHNIGVDWPISYESLLPYFDINEKEMALSGLPGDPY